MVVIPPAAARVETPVTFRPFGINTAGVVVAPKLIAW